MSAAIAEVLCLHCGGRFHAPFGAGGLPLLCSEACREARRVERDRGRWQARKATYLATPERALANRARNAAWCRANRNCKAENMWLKGAPPYASHLPGGAMSMAIRPAPRWPLEHRNTRGLHGALTAIVGAGHIDRQPVFSIFPWQRGWAVYGWRPEATSLANTVRTCRLYDQICQFTFGPLVRMRTPVVKRRGRHRIRLHTISTVAIASQNHSNQYDRPTAESIIGTLVGTTLQRLGFGPLVPIFGPQLRLEMVGHDTSPAYVRLGDKFGTVKSWEGTVDLDANAPARWLLEVAARSGLGSRNAFGFGRIRVEDR